MSKPENMVKIISDIEKGLELSMKIVAERDALRAENKGLRAALDSCLSLAEAWAAYQTLDGNLLPKHAEIIEQARAALKVNP